MVRLIVGSILAGTCLIICFNSRDGAIDSREDVSGYQGTYLVSIPEMVRLIVSAQCCRFNLSFVSIPEMVRLIVAVS